MTQNQVGVLYDPQPLGQGNRHALGEQNESVERMGVPFLSQQSEMRPPQTKMFVIPSPTCPYSIIVNVTPARLFYGAEMPRVVVVW